MRVRVSIWNPRPLSALKEGFFVFVVIKSKYLKAVDFRFRCSLSAGQAVSHIRTFHS